MSLLEPNYGQLLERKPQQTEIMLQRVVVLHFILYIAIKREDVNVLHEID